MNTVIGRDPWCLFGKQFKTQATYIDMYTLECQTPAELHDEYDLELIELDLTLALELEFNKQKYLPYIEPKIL